MAKKDPAFSRRLKTLMAEKGILKVSLAKAAGVAPAAIGRYVEEGRIPEAPILLKIAHAFQVSVEYLLTGKNPPDPNPTFDPAIQAGKGKEYFTAPLEFKSAAGEPRDELLEETDIVVLHQLVKRRHGGGQYYGTWVVGSSMEPDLKNGSLAVCKREAIDPRRIKKGDRRFYCVEILKHGEEGTTIKMVEYDEKSNDVLLIPMNLREHSINRYKPRDIRINGRAVGIAWQTIDEAP